jgi:hypothetical protein
MSLFAKEWELAIGGNLQAYLDQADAAIMDASLFALHAIVEKGRRSLRGIVAAAGLSKAGAGEGWGTGRSLASAIRYQTYPANPTVRARNPAALLYVQPSAVHIFEAFEEGATIRAREGRFITIPVPGSPAARENFGDKPQGQTVLEKLKARGVEVKFVPATPTRPAMLVADNVRVRTDRKDRLKVSRATRTKADAYATGAAAVPLFFLVEQARIDKRINLARAFERLAEEFVDTFAREFNDILGRTERDEAYTFYSGREMQRHHRGGRSRQ